ncbi:MAG: YeeE/YedE family protein [Candidatus Aegiribacteria sp.]|nr:YeeE/YedE family protein [Candidatus Aegiribacteria sp.]MBD3295553.1 YeeE/YedE family protein [Candidatus Fermentibacteria bacterium]
MFSAFHAKRKIQLVLGLLAGILFGFLLQKGGVTKYGVILSQLLLRDFTVLKVMLSAVIVGSIGIHAMRDMRMITFHPKPTSISSAVIGGLLFGVGFATMGYCPGTLAGATGNGYLDAVAGGAGVILGAGLFAMIYKRLQKKTLKIGQPKKLTLPEVLGVNSWVVVITGSLLIAALMWWLESMGL